jgi:hypothetical protein
MTDDERPLWFFPGSAMTADERQRFKELYQDKSVEELEALLTRPTSILGPFPSQAQQILRDLIVEKRHAADAPERERFEKDYVQRERHHREGKRSAWIAAIISLIGALASWGSFWFQTHHSQPTATPVQSTPAVASPTPATQE